RSAKRLPADIEGQLPKSQTLDGACAWGFAVNGQIPHSQGKAFRVVTTIWLLLLTGLVVFDHAQIGHRIEAHPPDAEAPKLANLEGELAALQVIVSAIQRQPTSVRATEFEAFERAQSA